MNEDKSYNSWIISADKCDLHCHAARGAGINYLNNLIGGNIKEPIGFTSVSEMNQWFNFEISSLFPGRVGYELLIQSTINEAINDNVKYLIMGFAIDRVALYNNSVEYFVNSISKLICKKSNIRIIPELSIPKTKNYIKNINFAKEAIQQNFFKSIDLVGEELDIEFEPFVELYRYAKKAGLRLRAHVGEFGNASSIKRTCELLELDEVQHGITAVTSNEVIRFLRNNRIQLNICPSSNVKMGIVNDYQTHPIRKLFDEGVIVTINTDDRSIFNHSISEEYIELFNSGCFSANELETIRIDTLNRSKIIWEI